jgi:hypothetical protein
MPITGVIYTPTGNPSATGQAWGIANRTPSVTSSGASTLGAATSQPWVITSRTRTVTSSVAQLEPGGNPITGQLWPPSLATLED